MYYCEKLVYISLNNSKGLQLKNILIKEIPVTKDGKRLYKSIVRIDDDVVITHPPPNSLTQDYELMDREDTVEDERLLANIENTKMLLIADVYKKIFHRQAMSFLDVACGNGFSLVVAKKVFSKCEGIEISRLMVERCKLKGLLVNHADVFEFEEYSSYDILYVESLVEHLPDPVKFINRLSNQINDQSLVCFGQAVYNGLVPTIIKGKWYGWCVDQHYFHYTSKSFEELLCRNGFKVVAIKRSSLLHKFYFGPNIKRLIFRNIVALIALVSKPLNLGDHCLYMAKKA